MSWVIFFVFLIIIVNLFDSKSKSDNRRPPRPKPSPNPVERVKPRTSVPPATIKPDTPLLGPISIGNPLLDDNCNYLQVNLTPEGYLSSFEKNKRRLLLSGTVSHSRLKLIHDRANQHDSKAIKVLLDDVSIGFVRKYDTNGEVDRFCFKSSKLKADLRVSWNGSQLLLECNDEAEASQIKGVNPLQSFGVSSLWHMSHVDNIPSILSNGIASNNTAHREFTPRDISNSDVQSYRGRNDPIYNRRLHEYAPTYLSIKNPMLYVKKDMYFHLCIIELDTDVINNNQFLLTDGNAASKDTKFFNKASELCHLPWDVLNADYWSDFDDGKRKRCSEVMIFPSIDKKYIKAVHCSNFTAKRMVEKNSKNLSVLVKVSPELFF